MSAQLAAIQRDLDRHAHIFDPAEVAEPLFDIAADGIMRQMDREQAPDGSGWPALSPGYEDAKSRIAPGAPMAVLFGHMKQIEQIRGQRWIGPTEARMEYGLDELAKDLARWFSEGDGGNQPPRPFYGLGDETTQLMDDFMTKRFNANV